MKYKDSQDIEIVQAMEKYGGSFVKSIAAAALNADEPNYNRLKAAFPELWEKYSQFTTKLDTDQENLVNETFNKHMRLLKNKLLLSESFEFKPGVVVQQNSPAENWLFKTWKSKGKVLTKDFLAQNLRGVGTLKDRFDQDGSRMAPNWGEAFFYDIDGELVSGPSNYDSSG